MVPILCIQLRQWSKQLSQSIQNAPFHRHQQKHPLTYRRQCGVVWDKTGPAFSVSIMSFAWINVCRVVKCLHVCVHVFVDVRYCKPIQCSSWWCACTSAVCVCLALLHVHTSLSVLLSIEVCKLYARVPLNNVFLIVLCFDKEKNGLQSSVCAYVCEWK